MKKIAIMTWTDVYGEGGMGWSIQRIAKTLVNNFELEIDILMLMFDQEMEFSPRGNNGIQIEPAELDSEGRIRVFKIGNWAGGERELHKWGDVHRAVLELCEERQYSLIHGFYASISGFIAAFVAKELSIPSVISIRGCDVNRDIFNTGRFNHLKWALENATYVTALSKELLIRANVITEIQSKGEVILNSINPNSFSEETHAAKYSRPLIGTAGVFRNIKGTEVLFAAFQMILENHPSAHLLLIGDFKEQERARQVAFLDKYQITNQVTVTGLLPRRDIVSYMRALDIFAFTSLQDACPNTVLEAMLAEVPIVASRVGAVPDLITPGVHGELVQPGSAVILADALTKMLLSENRKSLAKNAKLRVLEEFSPLDEASKYMDIYTRLLQ